MNDGALDNAELAAKISAAIARNMEKLGRTITVMEVCGTHTMAIAKHGLRALLPKELKLVSGPGCPVCVSSQRDIDYAVALAQCENVIITSFGDMFKVRGSNSSIDSAKAAGADARVVYSPADAVELAAQNPCKNVIFIGAGFETTAPANAMAVWQAYKKNLKNFSILCSHVLVPPAMEALLSSSLNRVQGFLAAGHVCTVMGYEEYIPLAKKFKVPIVVTGLNRSISFMAR